MHCLALHVGTPKFNITLSSLENANDVYHYWRNQIQIHLIE